MRTGGATATRSARSVDGVHSLGVTSVTPSRGRAARSTASASHGLRTPASRPRGPEGRHGGRDSPGPPAADGSPAMPERGPGRMRTEYRTWGAHRVRTGTGAGWTGAEPPGRGGSHHPPEAGRAGQHAAPARRRRRGRTAGPNAPVRWNARVGRTRKGGPATRALGGRRRDRTVRGRRDRNPGTTAVRQHRERVDHSPRGAHGR